MTGSADAHLDDLETQRAASREVFGEELPLVELPTDAPRPPTPSYFREQATTTLGRATVDALDTVTAQADADRFDAVVAALAGLIEALGSQSDIVLGTAVGGNGLLLRVDTSQASTTGELLDAATQAIREAGRRRDVSLDEVLAISNTPATALRVIVLPDGLTTHLCPDGGDAFDLQDALGEYGAAADLVVFVGGDAEGELRADYDGEIFRPERIDALLAQLGRLVAGIADGADTELTSLSLLSDDQLATLDSWNATATEYPRTACVHELIAAQVQRSPNATAVRFRDESITYAEFDQRANELAHHLVGLGVGPDMMVGLWIPRSIDMLVAAVAIQKAGGAYVPMDPTYPSSRLDYMRTDSGATVVLSRSDVQDAADVAEAVLVDQLELPRVDGPPTTAVDAHNLAYAIYTSGSTGNPKGVMVEHQQAVNFFAGMDDRVGVPPADEPRTWLAVTSLSFDISVLELLWTLTHGFEVVIHSVAEESVSDASTAPGTAGSDLDASDVDFTLFYFGSDDGEAADLVGSDKYKLLTEGARFADTNGFTAVWTPERHFHIFGGMFPSPAVAASALAMTTDNVQLRSGSVVLPLHDPVRVAEEWQLVDNLSNGRVALSFASGWQPNDFVFAPQNYENRHDVMFEGIETIRALWRGETRTAPGGDGNDVEFITRPRPVQPELPVWVTCGGTPATFARAGAAGANVLTHLLGQTLSELGEKLDAYRAAWQEAGHVGHGTVSLMLHTFVGPDPDVVKAKVDGPLKDYLKGSVSLFTPFAESLGLDMANLTDDDMTVLADHAFERYYETSGLFGTPEQCMQRIHEVKALGVDEVACLIDFGIGRQDVLDHLPHLAELRDLCATTAGAASSAHSPTANTDFSIPGLINAHAVSHFQCTPSMAAMLLADAPSTEALAKIDVMMVGGEAFPMQVAQQLQQVLPEGRIINMYGPTETTIWSTTWELDDLSAGMTIGTPIANTQLYVLDRHDRRVPPGGIGELVIGGDGVTRGYHDRPELTAEKFVADPFRTDAADPAPRMYRTGDLARFRPDGTVDFLGRSDHQVKFRGFRIEMGEIEAAACEHESVVEAAVIVHGDGEGKRLVAYLVPSAGSTVNAEGVRAHLKATLTDYMVPTAYVELTELPLTPNKKVDRKALPAPDATNMAASAGAAPGNEVETMIAEIWQEVLKLPAVSTTDNFFDLGGHSLLVVHVLNQLRERTDFPVVMTDLFRFPTIASLADHISGEGDDTAKATQTKAQERAAARKAARSGQRQRRPRSRRS